MDCTTCRELLSARLDGEDTGLEAGAADAHLAGCPACQAFLAGSAELSRRVRVGEAEPIPDQTAAILARIGASERRPAGHRGELRVGLAIVGLLQLLLGLPALLGLDPAIPVHAARELGSFDVALAAGFLFAAWRPARAAGMLPLVAVLVLCLLVTAVLDVAAGRTPAAMEAIHALEVAGLVLLWRLASPAGTMRHPLPD
jgi:predicted anti-sigma-YlaC factor YlaD